MVISVVKLGIPWSSKSNQALKGWKPNLTQKNTSPFLHHWDSLCGYEAEAGGRYVLP